MKYQALFYQKNNEKNTRLSSAAVVISALRFALSEHALKAFIAAGILAI